MKSIIILFLFFSVKIDCQNTKNISIDSSNYYDFYHQQASKTAWLQEKDALNVFIEVLDEYSINKRIEYALCKLNSGEHIVVTVFCPDFNFGILYVSGHSFFPNRHERGKSIYEINTDYIYIQREDIMNGKPDFHKIKSLPKNILLLSENSYWYQEFNQNQPNNFVDKEIILKILKQDVQKLISTAKHQKK